MQFGVLGAKTGQTLDPYILKTTNLLKSIIEQMLLRIMLSTTYTFSLFFSNGPFMEFMGSAPKKCFSIYLKNDKEFLNNYLTIIEQLMIEISSPFI